MSKPDGGPALVGLEVKNGVITLTSQMTLRDAAAITFQAALIGVQGGYWCREPLDAAKKAADHADAFLAERDK